MFTFEHPLLPGCGDRQCAGRLPAPKGRGVSNEEPSVATPTPTFCSSLRHLWRTQTLTGWYSLPTDPEAAQVEAAAILVAWGWPPAANSDSEEVQAA